MPALSFYPPLSLELILSPPCWPPWQAVTKPSSVPAAGLPGQCLLLIQLPAQMSPLQRQLPELKQHHRPLSLVSPILGTDRYLKKETKRLLGLFGGFYPLFFSNENGSSLRSGLSSVLLAAPRSGFNKYLSRSQPANRLDLTVLTFQQMLTQGSSRKFTHLPKVVPGEVTSPHSV